MATTEGTGRYWERLSSATTGGHFRQCNGWTMSSIGLGTYLGESDDRTDDLYRKSIVRAVELGVNVIDSAINYRFGRSERSIGAALADLVRAGIASRDELVVATKAGFLSFDGSRPPNPHEYLEKTYLESGLLEPEDIAAGSHAMAPRYLEHQLERSLENLGLDVIDIFYIHNPETQLEEISPEVFFERLRAAFEFLETAVSDGKIQTYGTATWNAYRTPRETRGFLSLSEVVQCARDVAGEGHHFGVVQLPYNLRMREAYGHRNQSVGERSLSALEAAAELGVTVMASAAMHQSRLSRNLPESVTRHLPDLETDGQRAIQFVRSTPGITTALVGMSQPEHVEENLYLSKVEPLSPEAIQAMFNAA